MYLSPTIQAARERKIDRVIAATGCKRDVAIAALFGTHWDTFKAIDNVLDQLNA